MTRTEWALLAQWCLCRGVLPRGNNHYGKDIHEHSFQAMPAAWKDGRTTCVQTGTGPLTWSHNGEPSGIWDLNGNVGEWVSGLRLVCGELQILPNNDGADICNSQAADSLMWRAIHAATGALIPPRRRRPNCAQSEAGLQGRNLDLVCRASSGKNRSLSQLPLCAGLLRSYGL